LSYGENSPPQQDEDQQTQTARELQLTNAPDSDTGFSFGKSRSMASRFTLTSLRFSRGWCRIADGFHE